MQTVICPYCGRKAAYVDSAVIYHGHSYGMIYLCRPCNAYVGVHRGSDEPKGSLANEELREWRKSVHAAFDPLWLDGPRQCRKQRRVAAYGWLSAQMHLPPDKTHIGMFDVTQCRSAIDLIRRQHAPPAPPLPNRHEKERHSPNGLF